jgi:murein L,D-transpeptidase YafK
MKPTLLALFTASALITTILTARAERIDTAPLPAGTIASRIFIDKSERTLTLFRGEHELKTYKVALGRNPVGHKQQEGDGRTPEGRYQIVFHKRNSSFHRALRISYPNAEDIRSARERGVSPGGDIMIHGLPNGMGSLGSDHLLRDWTEGCIAVTNEEIEEIWRVVPDGTIVDITP